MIENDFSKGNVCRHILMQAVPLTIAQLIQLLYNVVDRIYIGHLPGTQGEALTGVGLVFPIISMIAAFTNLFSMGGAPLFSIARGEGDEKKASYILNNTFTMLVITAFVLMAVGYGWKRPILYLFGASDVTYPFANDYLTIYLAGTLFLMIGTGMNSFISAEGFPKTGMLVVICGAVINIVLDPLFIFVFHMGVAGAALRGAGEIFAVGSRPVCIETARRYGATDIINYREGDIVTQVMEKTGGKGVDKAIIAGGDVDTFAEVIRVLKPGGRIGNVNYLGSGDFVKIPRVEWGCGMGHKTVAGGLMPGGRLRMEKLASLLVTKRLEVAPLLTHRFQGFEHIEKALLMMKDKPRDMIKPVVVL